MNRLIRTAVSLCLSSLLLSAFIPPAEAKANSRDDRRIIISMGDSYSSGEGIEPFFYQDEPIAVKVNKVDWLAHRSEKAWSGMLELTDRNGNIIKMSDYHWDGTNNDSACWYFVAASGAETWNIFGGEDSLGNIDPKTAREHRFGLQEKSYCKEVINSDFSVSRIYEGTENLMRQGDIFDKLNSTQIDYVTLTLGGNDAGFADIMQEAATGCTLIDRNHLTRRIDESVRYITSISSKYKNEAGIETDGLLTKLLHVYRGIEQRVGKDTAIIVVGYPQLVISDWRDFNPWRVDGNFNVYADTLIDKEECAILNWAVNFFNRKIEQLVQYCQDEKGMNIHFVSVSDEFLHHEPGTVTPYLHSIKLLQGEDLNDHLFPPLSAYSFHPNEEGAKAYARCVQAKIDELEREKVVSTLSGLSGNENNGALVAKETTYVRKDDGSYEISNYKQYSYNAFGQVITEEEYISISGNRYRTTYDYNADGKINSQIHYYSWPDSIMGRILYEYDENGNTATISEYEGESEESLWTRTTYEYDQDNRKVHAITEHGAGAWRITETNYFYSDEDLIRIQYNDMDGALIGYTEYSYNPQHLVVTVNEYGAEGELFSTTYFEYDSAGRKIETSSL